jgi:thioredoxin reductase (NADPH)
VVVVGGDDEALQSALHAVSLKARSVTLVHRRSTLDGSEALLKQFHSCVSERKIQFITAQITHALTSEHQLTGLQLQLIDGNTRQIPCDQILIQLGLSPQLGPLADWGLDMARKQLNVNTEDFSTSAPGIFAVGDINTYPGKRKLIVSGFHEATLAAYGAAAYLRPGQKIPLEYTTASPRLHRLLGV